MHIRSIHSRKLHTFSIKSSEHLSELLESDVLVERVHDWPKKGDHKLSPIFKGPFVIVRPVGAVCYEIKSTTQQNKFIKVVHVQHLRPYFKRNTPTIEENSTDEETERY
ncbi:uncharacterized protein NPIL_334301 [Nephila pilipes]|uniref:Tf2-1-like SH3-like domain-containing protein n=1 Tax=Nephila pilipes TaxID=299642 RepID=A0A8X6MWJ7_NEPPI|nr:uncharacterized protein NPIL_334301 [Nephila pilipes]